MVRFSPGNKTSETDKGREKGKGGRYTGLVYYAVHITKKEEKGGFLRSFRRGEMER